MTLNKFIKQLQALQRAGYGRRGVAVDKASLWDGNGTFEICEVKNISTSFVCESDGDGFIVTNKDGSERGKVTVVIGGALTPKEAQQ